MFPKKLLSYCAHAFVRIFLLGGEVLWSVGGKRDILRLASRKFFLEKKYVIWHVYIDLYRPLQPWNLLSRHCRLNDSPGTG